MPCLISTSAHLLEFRKFPCRFGTHADNELVAQEGMGVQGLHFTLRREGVRIVLTAAPESSTTVNGNDIRRANIQDGDRIQVGQLMLIYSNPSGQQNHLAGQMNAKQPMALPSPTAHALPSPATSRQVVPPADAHQKLARKGTRLQPRPFHSHIRPRKCPPHPLRARCKVSSLPRLNRRRRCQRPQQCYQLELQRTKPQGWFPRVLQRHWRRLPATASWLGQKLRTRRRSRF